jgi:DNA replication protein DnaD
MTVNVTEKKTTIDGNFVTVKPGQRITSEKKLAAELEYTWRKTTQLLKEFEDDGMIERQPIGRGFILTVVNFKKYQSVLESTTASTKSSTFTSTNPSTTPSKQYKKYIDRLQNGKEKPIKESAKRGGWSGKGGRPE